jgi:hypothetical protein
MKNKNFQQQINDISAYSQINKAFRHIYGSPAASVLATLIYKYTYWGENNGLIALKTETGNTLHHFHISKLDISLDSGVSISSLEKDTDNNPLRILEGIQILKIISPEKANKSDRFVLYPNRIKAEIERVSKLLKEDHEIMKTLSQKDKRDFHKALKGKLPREEVYKKFRGKIEEFDLLGEDFGEISQNPASNEAENSSNEGRTKNTSKNNTKKTNPSSSKRGVIPKSNQQTTREELKDGIQLYNLKVITTQQMFLLLTRYIPENKGRNWILSSEDETYIKQNLSPVTREYMTATLEYIDTNIERMRSGERLMRFGSLLAGIFIKVIEAGIGIEGATRRRDQDEDEEMCVEPNFDFLEDL